MTFLIPTREQAQAGLRAMKTALTVAGPLTSVRREALDAVQKHLLRTEYDLDALEPISPEDLAAQFDDPALRTQFINGMATMAFATDHIDPREAEAIEKFAAALGVAPNALDHLRKFIQERLVMLRFDIFRRGLPGAGFANTYEEQGVMGVLKNIASFAGAWENKEVADKYHALEGYADGTLGKELWRFYKKNKFLFPGEKHGAPEGFLPHDLSHILGGYDVDYHSEGLVLGFQAGYRHNDPFTVVVFFLLQAEHGMKLTAFADATRGYFAEHPGYAEEIVRAFARGAKMNIDLTDGWDFWAVMDQPVEALRARYGIPPIEA
jgi:hypothetical protein